jgi:hypothetical protein
MVSCNLPETQSRESPFWFFVEVLLLGGFFFLVAGGPPPDVNEAHYLTKAKHYWDSSFAPHDFFLNSADAHLVFYWSVGWLTKFCSLTTTAWIGRWVIWLFLAAGLVSVSRSLGQRQGSGILSGVLFFVLQTNLHLAGEWVVGGVEAKGFAFGFCFLGISFLIRKKWAVVWVLLGFAVAFHVLVGGWIAILVVLLRARGLMKTRSLDKHELLAGAIGLCIGLVGLVPAWDLGASADATVVQRANFLSVHVRLSHHLLFSSFQMERYVKFAALCWISIVLWWCARPHISRRLVVLFYLALMSFGLCATGIVLDYGMNQGAALQNSLLRYYWFRTSDVLIPLAAALGMVSLGHVVAHRSRLRAKIVIVITAIIVVFPICQVQYARFWDPRARGDVMALPHSTITDPYRRRDMTLRIERHFLACCHWIRRHTAANVVVITPVRQQTFKWNAQRAEVWTRKDMPQDAVGLVKWYEQQTTLYPKRGGRRGLNQLSNDQIVSASAVFNANYLLISQFSVEGLKRFEADDRFVKQFPPANVHSYYAVYEVKHE